MRRATADITGSRPARPRAAYCLIGWITALTALALAVYLLSGTLMAMISAQNSTAAKTSGSIIMLTGEHHTPGQFRLLGAGLTTAGFQVTDMQLPADTTTAARQGLQEAISRLAGNSRGVWLTAVGYEAAEAWYLAGQLQDVAGIILITPDNLGELTEEDFRRWPADRSTVVFTAAEADRGSEIRRFFEKLTGEDATLFPASQVNTAEPFQYASTDGRTWLMIYPWLSSEWSLISPRILPDIASWLEDWAAAGIGDSGSRHSASWLMITLIFQLLLAGVLLLAVPFALSLAMLGTPTLIPHPEDPEKIPLRTKGMKQIGYILLWLPAEVVAVAIGIAVAWMSGRMADWMLPALLLLPGCRGWLVLIGRLINSRWHEYDVFGPGSYTDEAERPVGCRKILPSRVLGLVMLVLATAGAFIWIWMAFGSFKPIGWPVFILPVIFLVGLPAGLAGSPGQTGIALAIGTAPAGRWYQSVSQHLPYIFLLIAVTAISGWPGFTAGLLLLAIDLWSVSMGKAATLLSCRAGIGSLVQAIAWSTAILMPTIANRLIP